MEKAMPLRKDFRLIIQFHFGDRCRGLAPCQAQEKVLIYVDTREQQSSVLEWLMDRQPLIKVKQLEVGDYVLSDQIVIERKTTADFLSSMLDGRLFDQCLKMSSNYEMPLFIIEGNPEDLYTSRNIHKNAVIGALTTIALHYRLPVLFTKNAEETANFLYVTAKREQLGGGRDIRLRVGRKGLTLPEQQLFIMESLPSVGPSMARALLKKFGSIETLVQASDEELQKVENLGPIADFFRLPHPAELDFTQGAQDWTAGSAAGFQPPLSSYIRNPI